MKKIEEELRKELGIFCNKVGHLINAGIPLLQTLDVVAKEMEGSDVGKVIPQIKDDVKKRGESCSKAFSKYPELFSDSFLDIIRAGEQRGILDTNLLKLAEWFEKGESAVLYVSDEPTPIKFAEPKPNAEIVKLVNDIISEAVSKRASDIHILPEEEKIRIRFRIDGVIQDIRELPKEKGHSLISHLKIMAKMDIAEKKLPQDGRILMEFKGKKLDLRVSTLPAIFGEKMTLRVLDRSLMLSSLKEITTPEEISLMKKLYQKPNGLILTTGPTGSGRTTLLYSILNEIKKEKGINITTIEDPVEYLLEGITQIPIRPQIGLTFAETLRSVLRSDPDVIMVGEIRDLETVMMVLRTAITGHLVLSSLHVKGAISTIRRMTDMGVKPFLIAQALAGIIAMRLVRILCPECKEKYNPTEREYKQLGLDSSKKISIYRPKGCSKCNNTGYHGRMALYEIFIPDKEIKDMIGANEDIESIRKEAIKREMVTLKQAGIKKILAGLTSINEVFRVLSVHI